jgi:DNA-binding MarR family transcriptional regulator
VPRSATLGEAELRENSNVTNLTAAEVQALGALADNHPMTHDELVRSVADRGMHLDSAEAAAAVRTLVGKGLAERTPAISLGKYRVTAKGRAWIVSGPASVATSSPDSRASSG